MADSAFNHYAYLWRYIYIAKRCHHHGDCAWHVLDYMSYQMRLRIPLRCNQIFNFSEVN